MVTLVFFLVGESPAVRVGGGGQRRTQPNETSTSRRFTRKTTEGDKER